MSKWADCSTQAIPFSLVYGAKTIVPVKVIVPSELLVLASKVADSHDRINNIKALDERRQNLENRRLSHQKQVSKAYGKLARPRTLFVGDLILKAVGHVQKALSASKFTSKGEDHTSFKKLMTVANSCSSSPNSNDLMAPSNAKGSNFTTLNIQENSDHVVIVKLYCMSFFFFFFIH